MTRLGTIVCGAKSLWAAATLILTAGPAAAQVTCAPVGAMPPAVAQCGNPEFQSCAINVGGIPRHFCMHVPDFPAADIPLVIGFHGGGGMASRAVNWLDKHTEQGMILVAPTALPSRSGCSRAWRTLSGSDPTTAIPDWAAFNLPDSCPNTIGPWPAGSPNGQDLEFIRQLLAEIDAGADIGNRYAVGFSSGAGMVMQLLITEPLASSFEGFALVANGINDAKANAVINGGGIGPFSAIGDDPRAPVMLIWGTADKVQLPGARIARRVEELAARANPPADCTPPIDSPQKTMACIMNNPMADGLDKHTLISRIEETATWLINFNRAEERPVEGLYPDLGHGGSSEVEVDRTMTTRRDYPAGPDGEPVTVLSIIDGRHVFPGPVGNAPPCGNSSCDIDGMEEILQFWRAHAGLNNLWR